VFIHELPDVKDLFQIIADEKALDPFLVEKDYWIMHALWGLQQQGFIFELKGGTSLSKRGLPGIINRFSEDIDIRIEPNDPNVKIGKNHDKPVHIENRKKFFDHLAKIINIPGMVANRNNEYDDSKMRNGGIDLIFKNSFSVPEKVKPSILLEIGFDQTTPNEPIDITSWAYEKTKISRVKISDNMARQVKCYLPEYTFVEKLQTISTKVRRQQETGKFDVNFLRHFYDLHMLFQLDRVKEFINTDKYKQHKRNRFRNQDNLCLQKNIAFNLDRNESLFAQYTDEFNKLQHLFILQKPSFREIYDSIVAIRKVG